MTPHRGDHFVSADLPSDKIPATGGCQRFAPEDDTEFLRALEISAIPFFERSLTFRFASLKLFVTIRIAPVRIDLGM